MAEIGEKDVNKCIDIRSSITLLTAFKTVFFVICLVGFSVQASQFLRLYLSFPIVTEYTSKLIDKFESPAITYCTVSRAEANSFCMTLPDDCIELDQHYDFICDYFPDNCENGSVVPIWVFSTDPIRSYWEKYVAKSGSRVEYFVYRRPWGTSQDEQTGPFFYSPRGSFNIFTCYSLYSRVNSSAKRTEVPLDLTISKTETEVTYFLGNMGLAFDNTSDFLGELMGVSIEIHSPFRAGSPKMKNFLQPGKSYEIEINIKEERLLEAPFETDCINYTSLFEINNKSGPTSKLMCVESCKAQRDITCFGCVGLHNVYPLHSGKKCTYDKTKNFEAECDDSVKEQFHKCVTGCKRDCLKTRYSFSIAGNMEAKMNSRHYGLNIFSNISIDFYMDPIVYTLNHRPQFQYVELFSNLGGYIGIWLGISLFALTDIIRGIIAILTLRLLSFRQKK